MTEWLFGKIVWGFAIFMIFVMLAVFFPAIRIAYAIIVGIFAAAAIVWLFVPVDEILDKVQEKIEKKMEWRNSDE